MAFFSVWIRNGIRRRRYVAKHAGENRVHHYFVNAAKPISL